MGKIGTTELLVVLAIVLVIFGPKALPKLGRSLGKTLGSFRKGMNDSADDDDDDEEEVVAKKKKKKPVAKKADDEEDEDARIHVRRRLSLDDLSQQSVGERSFGEV